MLLLKKNAEWTFIKPINIQLAKNYRNVLIEMHISVY